MPFVKETVLSLLHSLGTLVGNHLAISTSVYFWALYSVPFVSMSVFIQVPYHLDYCYFIVCFDSRKCEISNSDLFQCCFVYSESLEIPYEFYDELFYFCKKHYWALNRD